MKPVWMVNDIGGIVYIGKNEIDFIFAEGVKYGFRIITKDLLELLWSMSDKEWETDKFLIEPKYYEDGALLVVITYKEFGEYVATATVFRCDLIEVLETVESIQWLN
ncbi:MAG TPA: hypothetical protein VLH94_00840 [Spirochaetia bacterium]|nr:hypothetical protein [Spirochaetia bacterium]